MSKKSAKPAGPVTRRQQVAALRILKTQQVAEAVAQNIREAVKTEMENQLKAIKDTMLSLIDRVMDLESTIRTDLEQQEADVAKTNAEIQQELEAAEQDVCDGDDRPEGEEAPTVPGGDEVAPGSFDTGNDLGCPNTCQNGVGG